MKICITFLLLVCSLHMAAQKKKKYWDPDYASRSKFFLSFGAGASIPLQTPGNTATGSLVLHNRNVYLQMLSATYFPTKKWGIEFNVKINPSVEKYTNTSDSLYNFSSPFHSHIAAKYGDRYFVSTTQFTFNEGVIPNFVAGPVYKFTSGKLMFVPKLLFGVNTFYFQEAFATLKEKNGNEIVDLSFVPKDEKKVGFVISPGFTASYRLRKHVGINIDLNYYRSSVSYSYTVTSHNYKSQEVSSFETNETDRIQWLNIGAGVSFLLK